MEFISWLDELRRWKTEIQGGRKKTVPGFFREEIGRIPFGPVTSIKSETSINSASNVMLDRDCDFALVRDAEDSIQGVVGKQAIARVLVRKELDGDRLKISIITDSNICIEPCDSTVQQVLDRITFGEYPCAVVVDRTSEPIHIVSARELLFAVKELVPTEVDAQEVDAQEVVAQEQSLESPFGGDVLYH